MIYDFIDILTRRLLAWSILSIAAGAFIWFKDSSLLKGIAVQAGLWGVVDAGVALWGRRGILQKITGSFDPQAALLETQRIRRLLWINAGLDVIYVAAGLALALLAQDSFASGNGWGVVIQGGFLLVFDLLHVLGVPEEIYLPDLGIFKDPQHEDYWLEGGQPAAIVVHGFPGTPDEMRTFADALHAQGWSVRGLLLSGYGAQMPELFQHRVGEWAAEIHAAVEQISRSHHPVLLVGYSMGGGLSVLSVAAGAKPDALALLAPFWWYQPPWSRGLINLSRIFLPLSFKPLPFLNLSEEMIRQALKTLIPDADVDWDSPETRQRIQQFRAPLFYLDMFRRMGTAVEEQASRISGQVLVVQGKNDPIVKPALTRRLVRRFDQKAEVEFVEVDSDHEINLPRNRGNPAAVKAVAEFAARLVNIKR